MYDGSITINTKIDNKNVKGDLKKILGAVAGAFNGILFQSLKVGIGIRKIFDGISRVISTTLKRALVGGLLFFALSAAKLFATLRETLQDAIKLKGGETEKELEGIKNTLAELKATVGIIFLPLIEVAIPYIKQALDWLVKLFNQAAAITAAFAGQKQVMQVVAGSAAKLAKESEKTKKSAQGALAAFDQLNVLQKKDTDLADLPKVETRMVPITEDILSNVQKIKDVIASWWDDPLDKINELWGKIPTWFKANVIDPIVDWWQGTWLGEIATGLWHNMIDTWRKILVNSIQIFLEIKENIIKFFNGVRDFIVGVFTGDWALAWQGLKDIVSAAFENLWLLVKGALTNISLFLQGWGNALKIIFAPILEWLENRFETTKIKILAVWDSIKMGFQTAFGGMRDFAKNIFNSIIDFINRMVQGVATGINTIINAANGVGTIMPGYTPIQNVDVPRIPRLATGAVIPANSEFLAVLGDQRSGRNIEAPEGLIRQIINEEMGKVQAEITIGFSGNLAALVRELKPHIDRENVRVGGTLIRSGVVTS